MRTIMLLIEYDGTAYAGWQIQPNGRTVQEIVEHALAALVGAPIRLHSSGRTDAGVHARGMAAHFETAADLPLKAFREGMNSRLPADIAIREVREVAPDFHARYSAKGKWYRYTIYTGKTRSPLAGRTSWHLRSPLAVETMRQAAGSLVGEHDFRAFRTNGCAAKTSVREIFSVDITTKGDFVYLDFKGSGFLKNMVRMIVGTLVEVGLGKRSPESVARILACASNEKSGPTAPAHGLCLEEVWY